MDMGNAAIAPRQPLITERDRQHPRFAEYQRWRQSCAVNLIECEEFSAWLRAQTYRETLDAEEHHPRFCEFQTWMRAEQAGARKCPAGNAFPANFRYWLDGGRW